MTEQERLTDEKLAELRRIAEAADFLKRHGAVVDMSRYHEEFDPPTVLTLLDEIERLRRERETFAAAVRGWQGYLERDIGTGRVHATTIEAHESALALLDGEKGGNVNPLAAYTDGQLYDELHRRGWVAATWPTKGGGGA